MAAEREFVIHTRSIASRRSVVLICESFLAGWNLVCDDALSPDCHVQRCKIGYSKH